MATIDHALQLVSYAPQGPQKPKLIDALTDLISTIKGMPPLFAPNQRSTYSNTAFELLGLVLANVTGLSYEQYIAKHILEPLKMSNTSFIPPPDSTSVLPKGQSWYWNVDQGVHKP
jgi:CubicO group peptidase (beta-lactamase class C family)